MHCTSAEACCTLHDPRRCLASRMSDVRPAPKLAVSKFSTNSLPASAHSRPTSRFLDVLLMILLSIPPLRRREHRDSRLAELLGDAPGDRRLLLILRPHGTLVLRLRS